MNEIMKVFSNAMFGDVRIILQNDEPWFVAKDVCECLEISNSRQALSRLDTDEKADVILNDGSQNGYAVGQNRLFEQLRNEGFLISRKGNSYNMPTQKAMELGLFRIKETAITHSDGRVSLNKTPKVTGKGQQYFINRFIGK